MKKLLQAFTTFSVDCVTAQIPNPKSNHLVLVERCIGRVIVVEEEHIDEVDKDAGSILRVVRVVCTPLEDDHEDQIPEEAKDEDHLWDELQDNVQVILKVSER